MKVFKISSECNFQAGDSGQIGSLTWFKKIPWSNLRIFFMGHGERKGRRTIKKPGFVEGGLSASAFKDLFKVAQPGDTVVGILL